MGVDFLLALRFMATVGFRDGLEALAESFAGGGLL
jgi:hypothetical protein